MPKILSFDALVQPENYILPTYESTNQQQLDHMKQVLSDIIKNELTDRQKQMILLYYYQHKNTIEIAQELGLNKSTVSRTLSAAHNHLARFLRYC